MDKEKKNDVVKRVLLGAAAFGIIGMAGWAFIEVRDLPATYPSRAEVKADMGALKHDVNERLDRIEKKLDILILQGR